MKYLIHFDMAGLVVNGKEWSFMNNSIVTDKYTYTRVFGYNALRLTQVVVVPPNPSNDNKENT